MSKVSYFVFYHLCLVCFSSLTLKLIYMNLSLHCFSYVIFHILNVSFLSIVTFVYVLSVYLFVCQSVCLSVLSLSYSIISLRLSSSLYSPPYVYFFALSFICFSFVYIHCFFCCLYFISFFRVPLSCTLALPPSHSPHQL